MAFRARSFALATVLSVWALARPAHAALGERLGKTVVTLEAPVALPLSAPLRDRFGLGTLPAVSANLPLRDWMLAGLRLRWGILWNGPAPADRSIKDPGYGGLTALSLVGRIRPSPGHFGDSLAEGPWLEIGAGSALTGSLVRALGEAALGWNMRVAGIAFGPSIRYLHVIQMGSALENSDAQVLLAGLEVALHDARPMLPASIPAAAVLPVADRDGDGIPDNVDKCPDAPEDKDGFEDEDGCPDDDNDKDGIPDADDACPNDPETVNGFEDEDGCPDELPAGAAEERIPLEEHVYFDTNRSSVGAESRGVLAAAARKWKQHPEWDRLVIDGHADRHGSDDYNLALSRDRAAEVLRNLVELGVPADRLRIRAFGNRKLLVPGEDPESDRENRRVDLVAIKKNESGAAPNPPSKAKSSPKAQVAAKRP